MATTSTKCNWAGKSGKTYEYHVYELGFSFAANQPGNYIFAKLNASGQWVPQYIGQTKDLKNRLGDHEKEACAKRNGATHIHAHLNPTEAARLAEEKDLIECYNPPCNTQHAR
jgi:excinuclease UvrABC nuclease subunit